MAIAITVAAQLRVQNATLHPATAPIYVPAGTPRTEATAIPLKMIVVANPTDLVSTNLGARLAASAQTPPMLTPRRTRATARTTKLGARAVRAFAAATNSIKTMSVDRRSKRRVTMGTNGAVAAATNPVMASESPMVPSLSARSAPIGVSSPTGIISAATTMKVDAAIRATAAQWFSMACAWVEDVGAGLFCPGAECGM